MVRFGELTSQAMPATAAAHFASASTSGSGRTKPCAIQTQSAVLATVPAIIGHFTAHSVQKPSATTGAASQFTNGGLVAGPPSISRGRSQRPFSITSAVYETV